MTELGTGPEQKRLGTFWSTVLTLAGVYLFLKYGVPYLSMLIVRSERPLPMPSALLNMFMILTIVGALVYVSVTEEKLRQFLTPILTLLRGRPSASPHFQAVRMGILILVPLAVGYQVYNRTRPSTASPTALRIQHPTIPGEYENLKNPLRELSGEAFAQAMEEGIIQYQKNCRPCHGTRADGQGPMARGFRLKPANFGDPGTIATVVESYALWRVTKGAPGLPPEASPWDSAMPTWEEAFDRDLMWKIIMAEYRIGGVEPRIPEKLQ